MQPIPEKLVDKAWKRIATLPADELPRLMERMVNEQPEIVAFLMSAGYEDFNQEERELQLYLGTVVWQIMKMGEPEPEHVTEKRMFEMISRAEAMAEFLTGENEDDFESTALTIFENYNQINVLRYVVDALFEEHDDMDEEIENALSRPLPVLPYTGTHTHTDSPVFPLEEEQEKEQEDEDDEFLDDEEDEEDALDAEQDEQDDSEGVVRLPMKGLILMNLKIVIDALDQ